MSKAATQRAALDAAISAVENYLKALTLASSPSEKQRLDAKCKELLRKAEDIKKSEFWNQHLQTRTNTSNSSSRVRPRLREPVSTRNLSNREQIILLEDSKLNGYVFPPWSAVPDAGEFELEEDGDQFTYVKADVVTCPFSMVKDEGLIRYAIGTRAIFRSQSYSARFSMAGNALQTS